MLFRSDEYAGTAGFPVPIEGKPQKFSFGIEHGTAGIASRNVIIGDKADIHFSLLIGISTEITGGKKG